MAWIANSEAGSSVRGKLNAVPDNGSLLSVVTGASPVTLTEVDVTIIEVTSGGTAGTEIIYLNDYAGASGYPSFANPFRAGKRVIIALKTLTNPSDVVVVRRGLVDNVDGSDYTSFFLADQNDTVVGDLNADDGVPLSFAGAAAGFAYRYDAWFLDQSLTDFSNGATILDKAGYVPAGDGTPRVQLLTIDSNSFVSFKVYPVPGTTERVTTGASEIGLGLGPYTTLVTTGGTAGTEKVYLQSGVAPGYVGSRRVVSLDVLTNPSDILELDTINGISHQVNIEAADGSALTSITFDTVHQYLILEAWSDDMWRVVRGTAIVV